MSDDRKRITIIIQDSIVGGWLNGISDDEDGEWLRQWWETDEAASAAYETAHTAMQALEDAGYDIVKRAEDVT